MHITEEELNDYFELKNNFENNNLKLTEQDLFFVNKVNNHVRTCTDCMSKYKEKENKKEYQNDTEIVSSNEILENMDLLDIDSYDIVITDDVPTIVNGENLDPARVKFFYEYPEALDKQTLSKKERLAYLIAIKKFQLMKEAKQKEIEKEDVKKYVKVKKNLFNQTGFTNTILLSLLTGFAGGVITTIMYIVIK